MPTIPSAAPRDEDPPADVPTAAGVVTDPADPAAEAEATAEPVVAPQLVVAPEVEEEATWESLSAKERRTDKAYINSMRDGRPVRLRVDFVALDGPAYDKLMDLHPAKPSHQAKGYAFNPDTFPAALLEQVVTSPRLSYEQWYELSKSKEWAGGEFGGLFNTAQRVCQGGLDIPFTGLG